MNKNTIIAIIIILLSIQLFQSKFYYEKIIKKPHPSTLRKIEKKEQSQNIEKPQEISKPQKSEIKPVEIIDSQKIQQTIQTPDSSLVEDTIWIETEKIICGIREKGGRIISIKTKEYTYNNKKKAGQHIELISNQKNGGLNVSLNEVSLENTFFKVQGSRGKKILVDDSTTVEFTASNVEGSSITKKFRFYRDSYMIGISLLSGISEEKNITFEWSGGITESEDTLNHDIAQDERAVHIYDGSNVENITLKKLTEIERTGSYKWVGLTSKYFMIALIPAVVKDMEVKIKTMRNETIIENDDDDGKRKTSLNYQIFCKRFVSSNEEKYNLYVGPTKLSELTTYNEGLNKVLFKGYKWFFWADKWFPILCEFVLKLLVQIQKIVKDYGVAIITLTIILNLITWPLKTSSTKSMSKMKDLQPKINKIREKYKGNAQKMNQKIMELYKEEGVNPLGGMGGCLPLLLQMPIFIALYTVLRKAIELRGTGTFLVPWVKDLSKAEILIPLGFNVPMYGNNIALLPILMAILVYFQNKMTIKDPNQKSMIYMMPIFMLVMFNNLPSGLSLYFVFSSLFQIIQQIVIDKGSSKKTAIRTQE